MATELPQQTATSAERKHEEEIQQAMKTKAVNPPPNCQVLSTGPAKQSYFQ
jgi:hypothetical protein